MRDDDNFLSGVSSDPKSPAGMGEPVAWRRVNGEPFEYAIQQGPHGDEFVKLLDGSCLCRTVPDDIGQTRIATKNPRGQKRSSTLSEAQQAKLVAALLFYANPESYHAIAFMADRPAGEFADDCSKDEWVKLAGYNRAMPGKRARKVLEKFKAELGIETMKEIAAKDNSVRGAS